MRKLSLLLPAAALAFGGLTAAHAAPGQDRAPMADMTRAQAQQRAEQMFERMDANKDGTLNAADRAARQAMMFDKIDTDRNGSISRAEFEAHHAAMKDGMGKRMGHRGGKMHGGEHRMGGDHAMTLTKSQFLANAMNRFDKADADRNGVVTTAERQAARQAMRSQWQARKAAAAPQG